MGRPVLSPLQVQPSSSQPPCPPHRRACRGQTGSSPPATHGYARAARSRAQDVEQMPGSRGMRRRGRGTRQEARRRRCERAFWLPSGFEAHKNCLQVSRLVREPVKRLVRLSGTRSPDARCGVAPTRIFQMLLVGGLVGGVPCRAVRPCAWDTRPHLKMGSHSSATTPSAQPPAAYNPKLAPDGTYLIPMARQDPQGGFCFGSALRETS